MSLNFLNFQRVISSPVDYQHNKNGSRVRTSVRDLLRTEVRTTNGSNRGQSTGHDIKTHYDLQISEQCYNFSGDTGLTVLNVDLIINCYHPQPTVV